MTIASTDDHKPRNPCWKVCRLRRRSLAWHAGLLGMFWRRNIMIVRRRSISGVNKNKNPAEEINNVKRESISLHTPSTVVLLLYD